jgi:hypothetical protein
MYLNGSSASASGAGAVSFGGWNLRPGPESNPRFRLMPSSPGREKPTTRLAALALSRWGRLRFAVDVLHHPAQDPAYRTIARKLDIDVMIGLCLSDVASSHCSRRRPETLPASPAWKVHQSHCRSGRARQPRRRCRRERPPMAGPDGSRRPSGSSQSGRITSSQVLPESLEEWMPDPALRRLGPVFNFGQQLGLNPDTLVRDALGVGLCLADQRR